MKTYNAIRDDKLLNQWSFVFSEWFFVDSCGIFIIYWQIIISVYSPYWEIGESFYVSVMTQFTEEYMTY